jgi:hypothetical protein
MWAKSCLVAGDGPVVRAEQRIEGEPAEHPPMMGVT